MCNYCKTDRYNSWGENIIESTLDFGMLEELLLELHIDPNKKAIEIDTDKVGDYPDPKTSLEFTKRIQFCPICGRKL